MTSRTIIAVGTMQGMWHNNHSSSLLFLFNCNTFLVSSIDRSCGPVQFFILSLKCNYPASRFPNFCPRTASFDYPNGCFSGCFKQHLIAAANLKLPCALSTTHFARLATRAHHSLCAFMTTAGPTMSFCLQQMEINTSCLDLDNNDF